MQAYGNPPEEIVNELAPGMDMKGADGLPNLPTGAADDCKVQ
jgi:hypothetical protein